MGYVFIFIKIKDKHYIKCKKKKKTRKNYLVGYIYNDAEKKAIAKYF